jgi:hypothetical protein
MKEGIEIDRETMEGGEMTGDRGPEAVINIQCPSTEAKTVALDTSLKHPISPISPISPNSHSSPSSTINPLSTKAVTSSQACRTFRSS